MGLGVQQWIHRKETESASRMLGAAFGFSTTSKKSSRRTSMSESESFSCVAISPVAGIRIPLDKDFLGDRRLEDVIETLRSAGWAVNKATQGGTDAE